MKKWLIGLFTVILVLIAICFTIKTSITKELSLKVEELNKNGFSVTTNSSNLPMKVKATGEVQIIDALKALEYISKNINESELKDILKELGEIFDDTTKQKALEGTKFDYDFTINVFSKKLDLNIYLSQLSTIFMQELENSDDNLLKEILNLVKEKAIHLNIDENQNYVLSDISFGNDGSLVSLRAITGDKTSLNIGLFKIVGKKNDSFIIEDIKSFYSEKEKSIDAKLSFGNIALNDETMDFKIKNLYFDTNAKRVNELSNTKDKISFDELILNRNDATTLMEGSQKIDLKNSQITFELDNLPYKKYKEMLKLLDSDDDELFLKVFDEFIKELVKSDLKISSKGEAENYTFDGEKLFEKVRFDANLKINKNLSLADVGNLKDILEKIDIKIDLDKTSADKLIAPLKEGLGLNYKNIENDELKRFEITLKDGFYVNDIKLLDEKELSFAPKDVAEGDPFYYDNENLNFSYEKIDENLLKITFSYKSSLNEDSQKGIVVSFPQLKDKSRVMSGLVGDLKEINFIDSNSELFTINPYEKIKSTFLVVEAYDDTLSENSIKEFSLILNTKDFEADVLEINLRAYSIGSTNSDGTLNFEIVPAQNENLAKDEQLYPVKIADIDLISEE